MNQIWSNGFKLFSQQRCRVGIVVLGAGRIGGAAQVIMKLYYRNSFVLRTKGFVMNSIRRRRVHVSNHVNRMARVPSPRGQAMSIDLCASNVSGQVLMCKINDPQRVGLNEIYG